MFEPPAMEVIEQEASSICSLTPDTFHMIFASLSLRQIAICRCVCRCFHQTLTSPTFVDLVSSSQLPLSLLALRPPHHHNHHHHTTSTSSSSSRRHTTNSSPSPSPPPQPTLNTFDPTTDEWLRFDLTFLPFRFVSPVTSSLGLVYLWVDSSESTKSLVVCNPLNRTYQVLPQLGSAWSKHGSVLTGPGNRVLVLTELATLYYTGSSNWLKFSSNLPSKPRSPILVSDSVYALCDVGSPWRSQWKMFTCKLPSSQKSLSWTMIEKIDWGEVFDILRRPRLVRGTGNKILMVGGLKSSFSLNAACLTVLVLRLDLDTLEWQEAARMPVDMYRCFQESSKFKVFGGQDRVCFSAKRVGKLALCECPPDSAPDGVWRWIDGSPGFGDGLCRGFVFDATLNAVP